MPISGSFLLMPLLIYLSWCDIRTMEIPDAGWIIIAAYALFSGPQWLPAAAVFLILFLFSLKNMLGFGDVKLCAAMALLAGYRIVIIIEAASLLALLFCLLSKKGSGVRIPFAPFLCIAFLFAVLC